MKDDDDLEHDGPVDPDGALGVAEMLAAAARPRDLPDDVHESILVKALGGEVAARVEPAHEPEASADEVAAGEALRVALEAEGREREEHELVRVADALRAAHAPRALPGLRAEMLLKPALAVPSKKAQTRTLYASVVATLALAASVVGLMLREVPKSDHEASAPELLPGMIEARSTGELFEPTDFPQTGGTSDRIDRITRARSADLRRNRFVAWGVP